MLPNAVRFIILVERVSHRFRIGSGIYGIVYRDHIHYQFSN